MMIAERILRVISDNPKSSYDSMASKLGVGRATVSWEIKALREAGVLRRVGPSRSGHWQIVK